MMRMMDLFFTKQQNNFNNNNIKVPEYVNVPFIDIDSLLGGRADETFSSYLQFYDPKTPIAFSMRFLSPDDYKTEFLSRPILTFYDPDVKNTADVESQITTRLNACTTLYILPVVVENDSKSSNQRWTMERKGTYTDELALVICEDYIDDAKQMSVNQCEIQSSCEHLLHLTKRRDIFKPPVISYLKTVVEESIETALKSV